MLKYFPLILLLLAQVTVAQEIPPLHNYAPSEYGAENQNWAISQAPDKLVYVANNNGLLQYNGAEWALFPSPNETIMRSVMVIGSKIYTGCYMEFGYWEMNGHGNLEYTSLSKNSKEQLLEDEEFWHIINAEGKVLFQSKKRIYVFDEASGALSFVPADSSLPRIFETQLGIVFQVAGQGLFRFEGGSKVLIHEGTPLKEDEIINVFDIADGVLILTRHQGFFTLKDGDLQRWNIPADSILDSNSIYSGIRLRNSDFALGTISGGFLILDGEGGFKNRIDQTKGLRNNTVLSVFEDMDSKVWLGLDNGIGYVDPGSHFKVYNDNSGAIGSVYASAKVGEYLYLGTNQGLFYKKLDEAPRFRLIPGTQGQVWSLNDIDGTLFCGHHTGTYTISAGRATKIANIPGTWKIGTIPERNDLILQGNYQGLYILESQGGQWKVRNKIEGFDNSARYFEVLDTVVFVNHEYKGVFEIKVDAGFNTALDVKVDSLEPGFNSGIVRFGDTLYYAHRLGIMRYESASAGFVRDSVLSTAYTEGDYVSGKMVVDAENDNLWVFSRNYLNRIAPAKFNDGFIIEKIPLHENARDGVIGYESIALLEGNTYLLGTSFGYITLDLDKLEEKQVEVRIGGIRQLSREQSADPMTDVALDEEGSFAFDKNNLKISFYTPNYNNYEPTKYQYRLGGYYLIWSDWSEEPAATFENLPYGEYTFDVRAKIGDQVSANTASYTFTINKPWQYSNMAILGYVVLGVLFSFAVHSSYRKYYRRRQRKLIEMNERKMELAKAQNEKEIIKIKNEQLRKEFRSKSNELAASTLSIIRKNELLTQVKNELVSGGERKDFTRPIIDIIDKNLNKNDDWELFKEAFNNADRKFLKKLKKSHPNLSPNDIRLCAYLRLNLSSKEIAPLLNISARSVEIKRYRLRKKMDLSHDHNLVDYILKL